MHRVIKQNNLHLPQDKSEFCYSLEVFVTLTIAKTHLQGDVHEGFIVTEIKIANQIWV